MVSTREIDGVPLNLQTPLDCHASDPLRPHSIAMLTPTHPEVLLGIRRQGDDGIHWAGPTHHDVGEGLRDDVEQVESVALLQIHMEQGVGVGTW